MADTHKLTMDKAWLKSFIDNQIVPFRHELDKVANERDQHGVTMDDLLGEGKYDRHEKEIYTAKGQSPLAIGQLSKGGSKTGGDLVVAKIRDAAKSISDVYVAQIKLFKDLHENLETTITALMNGQKDALEKLDGDGFVDDLGSLISDFQGGGGGDSDQS